MRYSLWHRDTLIGHTELSYVRCIPKHRMGDLIPTDEGRQLLAENERLTGLELQLRRSDGRVVATEHIATQDASRLARLGREAADAYEFDDEELDAETRAAIEHDAALVEEWMLEREPDDFWKDYDSAGDDVWDESTPYYQIMVWLVDDAAIP